MTNKRLADLAESMPVQLAIAFGAGLVLRAVLTPQAPWWLAWVAPVPLLWLAMVHAPWRALGLTALAALVGVSGQGASAHLTFAAVAGLAVQWLIWIALAMGQRYAMLRHARWWTVFAYPVLAVAASTALATWLPAVGWDSLGSTQTPLLPLLQVASLFGEPAIVFLLGLTAAVMAQALHAGRAMVRPGLAVGVWAALLAATLAFGLLRLQAAVPAEVERIGMANTDGPAANYDALIARLAGDGASLILLPEKLASLPREQAEQVQRHFLDLAKRHAVWIALGMEVTEAGGKRNLAWLIDPQGMLVINYQKQHLAPSERDVAPGTATMMRRIAGVNHGLAIGTDMQSGGLGRSFARRDAGVMLVPAWEDAPAAVSGLRQSILRGVEGGYAVARNAHNGVMTVSDAQGRILARQAAGATTLLAALPLAPVRTTLYSITGDVFAYACMLAALLFMVAGKRK